MKIVGLDINNNVVEIRSDTSLAATVQLIEAPDECEIGCQYVDGTFMPRTKTTNELKMDALVKAVLTGDKTDLENL